MSVLAPQREQTDADRNDVPPLQSGDRLTRDEFERRCIAHPEIKKAELVEGVVYVASPLYVRHGQPHVWATTWLGFSLSATPGLLIVDNISLRLDEENEPQPDIAVYIDPQQQLPLDDFLEQTPVLIVEIASSSAAYDLHDKMEAYRRNGVREYVVFLAYERETR